MITGVNYRRYVTGAGGSCVCTVSVWSPYRLFSDRAGLSGRVMDCRSHHQGPGLALRNTPCGKIDRLLYKSSIIPPLEPAQQQWRTQNKIQYNKIKSTIFSTFSSNKNRC